MAKSLTMTALARRLQMSQRTLIRWHQLGLLPSPVKVKGPSGRGWRSVWEPWVEQRGKAILKLQAEGKTLSQIQALLATEALREGTEHKNLVERFVSERLPSGATPLDRFVEMMNDVLTPWPDKIRSELAVLLRERSVLEPVFYLLLTGQNPVLGSDKFGRISIGPDYLVPRHFGSAYGDGMATDLGDSYPRLFIGLYAPLRLVFRDWGFQMAAPTVLAAPKVWAREGDRIVEHAYVVTKGQGDTFIALRVPNSDTDVGPAFPEPGELPHELTTPAEQKRPLSATRGTVRS